jgi:hypothetical protein
MTDDIGMPDPNQGRDNFFFRFDVILSDRQECGVF